MGEGIAEFEKMWFVVGRIEGTSVDTIEETNAIFDFLISFSSITSKIALTKLIFLPTGDVNVTKNELIIARDVLEIAVQYSVATKDIPAFERYVAQLKCYYFDYK